MVKTSIVTEEATSKQTLYCSFCAKTQHEVKKLIAGPMVFICNECVELCIRIFLEESKDEYPTKVGQHFFYKEAPPLVDPRKIFRETLGEYVAKDLAEHIEIMVDKKIEESNFSLQVRDEAYSLSLATIKALNDLHWPSIPMKYKSDQTELNTFGFRLREYLHHELHLGA